MINDTHSHAVGDQVLCQFVAILLGGIRKDIDWVVRYGGEEFLIALPETTAEGAHHLVDRFLREVSEYAFQGGGQTIHVTASFGIASMEDRAGSPVTARSLLAAADSALYRAKAEGRNRIAVSAVTCLKPEGDMTVTMYGIKNCDTIKKAREWLDRHGIAYGFHDYKLAGIGEERLSVWCAELGWDALLNRSGTTFRKLSDVEKANLDQDRAVALMLAQPSMIRRPVLDLGSHRLIGFKPDQYRQAFGL